MSYKVILLSGQSPSNQIFNRFAGPYRLATELRNAGISTKVLLGLGYYNPETIIEVLSKYINEDTIILGISTTFFVEYAARYANQHSSLYYGKRFRTDIDIITNSIRSRWPNIKFVYGGPSARKKLEPTTPVDLVIEGYGDVLLVDYAKHLLGISNQWKPSLSRWRGSPLVLNPYGSDVQFDKTNILYTDEDGIIPGETLPLELSRGCIFRCKFCSFPLRGKGKNESGFIKCRENIIRELNHNYEKWGITNYTFVDDTFNDSITKLDMLHNIFRNLPFKIRFAAYIRADLLWANKESIAMLYEMGIGGAFYGIESLNPLARRAAGKGFSEDKLIQTLELTNNIWNNTIFTSSFIFGLPHDTPETIKKWSDVVLSSTVFKKHDLIFQPLYLLGSEATYATDFDNEMEKWGYVYDLQKKSWTNAVTNFDEMFMLSAEINKLSMSTPRPIGGFQAVSLAGYGLSWDKISNMVAGRMEDIDAIEKLTINRFDQYLNII